MDELTPQQLPVTSTPAAAPQSTQPVFYSLAPDEEAPRLTPWYKKRQIVIMVVSVLVLMVVAGVGVVFAMNMIQANNAAKQVVAQKTAAVQEMVANGTSQSSAARQAAFVDGCKGLADGEYMNCVSLIAIDNSDPTICDVLTGAEKQSCSDSATLVKATAGKSYTACDSIFDATLIASCRATLSSIAARVGDCAGYGVPAEFCDAQKLLDAAIATGDPASCDALITDAKAGCHDIFNATDADKDGLTLAEEHTLGTSDQNPDTDGDGYNDGDEVLSGHDPLKK